MVTVLVQEASSYQIVFGFTVLDKKWIELDTNQHRTHAMRLLDGLEVTAREKRLRVARAILYVAQGTPLFLMQELFSYEMSG